ncbi:UNVERIFIED_CONTAM: hypothetical protein Sradi_7277800 [Sesamum radiatum]|uniref:Integrase zinc-binding domain-containing protein n=1 Tax=Sesamum radiatum TaxID=300843 RepID=A0AAW2II78_SESRA
MAALLTEFHASPVSGHSGTKATLARLSGSFYWPGMLADVKKFVGECLEDISLDFVTHLSSSAGKTTIWVVVNRLSKFTHFIALPTHFTATSLASIFLTDIYRLHGAPKSIISDRDRRTNAMDSVFTAGRVLLSVQRRSSQKLSHRYFGPFSILRRIGTVAYELELLSATRIHLIFHVSLLKPCYGSPRDQICPLLAAPRVLTLWLHRPRFLLVALFPLRLAPGVKSWFIGMVRMRPRLLGNS